MQVLAFTSGGDGVKSAPIHCQTEQDGERRFSRTRKSSSFPNHIVLIIHSPRSAYRDQGSRHVVRIDPGFVETTQPTERRHHPVHRLHEGGQRGGAEQPEGAAQSAHPRGVRIGQDAQIRLLGDREHEHRRGRGFQDRRTGAQRSRYLPPSPLLFSTSPSQSFFRKLFQYRRRSRRSTTNSRPPTRRT